MLMCQYINVVCLPSHVFEFQTYTRLCSLRYDNSEFEQLVSLHQGKHTPCSGATKGTMPSCLLVFSKFFQKIPTTLSRMVAQAKSFLTETRTRER
jgi:hypothetical protein